MEYHQYTHPRPADSDEILAEIECLARSQNRLDIMHLLEQSPATITEMQDALNVHRTTTGRNLAELKKKNWVRSSPTERSYLLTTAGELVLNSFDQLIDTTRAANRLGSFVTRFPETLPVEKENLLTSRITCPEINDPLAAMSRLFELLEGTRTIRGFLPILGPMEGRVITGQIPECSVIEIVLRSTTQGSLRANQPSVIRSMEEAELVELFVTDEIPSFGIFLLDEPVVIITYDEDMRIHSILEAAKSREIFDWAERQFAKYKEAASPDALV